MSDGIIWAIIAAIVMIWLFAPRNDDGTCGRAGGILVQRNAGGVACVKPIDLERN